METSEKQKEEMKLLFSRFQELTLDKFLKPGVLQILCILINIHNESFTDKLLHLFMNINKTLQQTVIWLDITLNMMLLSPKKGKFHISAYTKRV